MTKDKFIDGINALKQSEWFNRGKECKGLIIDGLPFPNVEHVEYLARKEAIEIVCDLFSKDFECEEDKDNSKEKIKGRSYICGRCGYKASGLTPDFNCCPICSRAMLGETIDMYEVGTVSEFISRKQFIAATQSLHCETCDHRIDCLLCNVGRVIRKIKNFPSADVAPVVHGHWENKYERHYIFFGTCSACKHVCQENNICGNCGAIMDEKTGGKE